MNGSSASRVGCGQLPGMPWKSCTMYSGLLPPARIWKGDLINARQPIAAFQGQASFLLGLGSALTRSFDCNPLLESDNGCSGACPH